MSEATCRIHGNVAYRGCAFCTISDLREALAAAERERDAAVEKAAAFDDVDAQKTKLCESNVLLLAEIRTLTAERDGWQKSAESLTENVKRWQDECDKVERIAIAEHDRLVAERDEAVKRAEAAEARLDRVKNACVCDELAAQLTTLRDAAETCTREYNSDEIRWDYWFDYDKVTAALASRYPVTRPTDNGSPTDAELADALAAHAANPQTPEQERAAFASSLVSDCDGVFDPTARPHTDTETGECDG